MHDKEACSTRPVKEQHGRKEKCQQCEQNRADKQLVHLVLSVVETPAVQRIAFPAAEHVKELTGSTHKKDIYAPKHAVHQAHMQCAYSQGISTYTEGHGCAKAARPRTHSQGRRDVSRSWFQHRIRVQRRDTTERITQKERQLVVQLDAQWPVCEPVEECVERGVSHACQSVLDATMYLGTVCLHDTSQEAAKCHVDERHEPCRPARMHGLLHRLLALYASVILELVPHCVP